MFGADLAQIGTLWCLRSLLMAWIRDKANLLAGVVSTSL